MKRYKNSLIITITLVLIFGLASSYAFFIYKGEGNDITLNSGNISLNFTSEVEDISIPSARPTSDGLGKIYPYYVDFDIEGTVIDEGIKYQIQLVPTANTTIDLSYIKGYLTDQEDNMIKDVFSYNDLKDINDSTGKEGKVIYNGFFSSSEAHHYRLRIWINDEYVSEIQQTFGFKVYLYAENGNPPPKCKRATTLHTETCSQTSSYCAGDGYTSGATITYGNLGSGSTLTTGDAFDCDVNGDGEYNSETERFYYVTDMNSDIAVLIYYNNVSGGLPDNMTAYAYNTDTSGYLGPQTAILQLPTTSQWKNVSLTNTTRDIKDENGTTRISGFSYSGYAARLLTYEEVQNGCYDGTTAITSTAGLSTKCKFLMENTRYSSSSLETYGLWLETPTSSYSLGAWYVYGSSRLVETNHVFYTSWYGVRPAIEVLKSDISL